MKRKKAECKRHTQKETYRPPKNKTKKKKTHKQKQQRVLNIKILPNLAFTLKLSPEAVFITILRNCADLSNLDQSVTDLRQK